MAAALPPDTLDTVVKSRVLVVGAGGIGCELLKNLVLTDFYDIDIIDLDTIELSNLNRQFLFQKKHVGKSKSEVARSSVLRFNPNSKVNIRSYCNSIQSVEYDVDFFKQFAVVLNALDNRAARSHVNRMCLAANVPLVESGTAGYLGQVTVIQKGLTECYECLPKPTQKTFPGCTIRNTPSEPIHCIVWAKHLFNQLFGEADPDEDVSPDREDPELRNPEADDTLAESNGNTGAATVQNGVRQNGAAAASDQSVNGSGIQHRISTRKWATENDYDPKLLFQKLFCDDIEYLLSMGSLWKKRRPPTPLKWSELLDTVPSSSETNESESRMTTQRVWNPCECHDVFKQVIGVLKEKVSGLPEGHVLHWDKDDEESMNFVTSCANLRAFVFGIPMKSLFDIKSLAGNIIPAIATTNAIIAGAIVMEALKILSDEIDECKQVYLRTKPNYAGKILQAVELSKPNPLCYVCSNKPEVHVKLNTNTCTISTVQEKILKQKLNMLAPDVELDGSGTILISSEEGETDELATKTLASFHVGNGSRLVCDDFVQKLNLRVIIIQTDELTGQDFEVIDDVSKLKPEVEETDAASGADDEPIMEEEIVASVKRPISPNAGTEPVLMKKLRA